MGLLGMLLSAASPRWQRGSAEGVAHPVQVSILSGCFPSAEQGLLEFHECDSQTWCVFQPKAGL